MNNFKDIKTGVIGVGSMGQNHARIYSEISNLVAVADPNEQQGVAVAERFGVSWYKNYQDMLEEVDAVSISVPTFLHREIAEKVAAARVHILVEKPLAISVDDSKSIINSAEKNGITLAVGHVERHNPVVLSLENFLNNDKSGNILTLTARRFSNYPHRISDVGVLFDLTIHDVQIINSLVASRPISVYATGGKSKNESHEDFINLVINYKNGINGVCQTSWLTPMKIRDLSVTTDKNFINVDFMNKKVEVMVSEYKDVDESNLYETKIGFQSRFLDVPDIEPLKAELIDFLGSVNNGSTPLVSGDEGLNAVKIVQAGLESFNTNKVINL